MDTTATRSRDFPFLFSVSLLVHWFARLNSQSQLLPLSTGSAAETERPVDWPSAWCVGVLGHQAYMQLLKSYGIIIYHYIKGPIC